MSRYFARKAHTATPKAEWDDPYPLILSDLKVDEHQPIDTGLVDHTGMAIWRAPNPMGFGRDAEW